MNVYGRCLMLAVLLTLASGRMGAQVKVDAEQRQLLLAAVDPVTIQKELDEAGKLGFRVVMGTTRGNGELVLMLERGPKGSPVFQSRLISGGATETIRRGIGDAALLGFRVIPRTFLNKGGTVVVIMERTATPTGKPKRYEYKLLDTNQTSTLEKEWMAAISQNYAATATITRNEVMILMEREETAK